MGYEICFKYHDKLKDGNYDQTEIKELRKKVGEPFEDVPLEKLVQVILSQMARRDIWVTPEGVEIFEYKKQKISFRETKGGLVIKNKKFMLDNESNIVVAEAVDEPPQQIPSVQSQIALKPNQQPHEINSGKPKRPIKVVVLDDGIIQDVNGNKVPIMIAIKNSGLQFQVNKKYPVFQEIDDPRDKRVDKFGSPVLDRKKLYVMWDDHKREVTVSVDYFVSADVSLIGGEEFNRSQPLVAATNGNKLMYDGELSAEMPSLR